MRDPAPNRVLDGFSWSAGYMVVTRATALVSVPLVLHGLGTRLYVIWVLAGSLVMIQSLFDLGVASAVVRFVALSAAAESRAAVVVITRRALLFYVGLSLAVAIPMWVLASPLAGAVSFVRPDEHAAAVLIVRWAAVAFGLTNITMVFASTLQGIDRVGPSYRDQTMGWLAYLPLLILGMHVGSHAQAAGLAWVGAFGLQLLLLLRSLIAGVRRIPDGRSPVPSNRELLAFGARWQVSAWADFATFQLPRFLGAFGMTAADALEIDVAIRAGQLAVGPVMAFYPTVLPRSTMLLAREGISGLRAFLQPYYSRGACVLVAAVVVGSPLEVPALAAWTGRTMGSFNPWVPGFILIGSAAHASTGLFTAAQLARAEVRSIIACKTVQLGMAAALMAAAAPLGPIPLSGALGLALAVPALGYNRVARRALAIGPVVARPAGRCVLVGLAVVQFAVVAFVVWALSPVLSAWALVAAGGTVSVTVATLIWWIWLRRRSDWPFSRPTHVAHADRDVVRPLGEKVTTIAP